jgi:hypothetical protein
MFNYVVVIASGILLVGAIRFFFRDRGSSPTTTETADSSSIPIHNTVAGTLIRDYLRIAFVAGNVTDVSEEATVERMRQTSGAVIEELKYIYDSIAREAYNARWAIIYCATKLESPAVLPFLTEVIKSSIPPEESRNIHLYSTIAEETTIRMRALEGIRLLAANGNREAQDLLFSFLQLPSLSLRIGACQALITLPDGERNRIRIREQLPTGEHYFLDLRHAGAENFGVCNAPLGDLVPPLRRAAVNPPPPLAEDAQRGVKPTIPVRPSPKGPPVIP